MALIVLLTLPLLVAQRFLEREVRRDRAP